MSDLPAGWEEHAVMVQRRHEHESGRRRPHLSLRCHDYTINRSHRLIDQTVRRPVDARRPVGLITAPLAANCQHQQAASRGIQSFNGFQFDTITIMFIEQF